MKEQILRMFSEHGEGPVSGQEVCAALGCSRTAVWKNIHALMEEGYVLDAGTNRGYQLLARPDTLTQWEIASRLRTRWAGRRLEAYERTEISTNTIVKKLAESGAPQGTLVVADVQEGGKGRRGREWVTPPPGANIAMSLLLRPTIAPNDLAPVTLVAALAVQAAVESMLEEGAGGLTRQADGQTQQPDGKSQLVIGQMRQADSQVLHTDGQVQQTDGSVRQMEGQAQKLVGQTQLTGTESRLHYPDVRIKWPNDIIVGTGKVTGILTELSLEEDRVSYVVVGIGINVNNESFPEELSGKATSLFLETGRKWSRAELVARCMERFEDSYERFEKKGFGALADSYESVLAGIGRRAVVLEQTPWEGKILGITEGGALIVEDDKGGYHEISSGEVSVRGINGYSP